MKIKHIPLILIVFLFLSCNKSNTSISDQVFTHENLESTERNDLLLDHETFENISIIDVIDLYNQKQFINFYR